MNARITRKDGWMTVETFYEGKVISVERGRTREWIERRNAVLAAVVAVVVLVGGLGAVVAKAEPVTPTVAVDLDPDHNSLLVRPIRALWPFPFQWPLIWVRNIDAGSIG